MPVDVAVASTDWQVPEGVAPSAALGAEIIDITDDPGEAPIMVNATQELDGGDTLPGFRVPVARLFE